jgi:hypothetical protein
VDFCVTKGIPQDFAVANSTPSQSTHSCWLDLHLINSISDSNIPDFYRTIGIPSAKRFPYICSTKLKITSNSKNPSLTYIISEIILNEWSSSAIWQSWALIYWDVMNCIWSLFHSGPLCVR